MVPESPYTGSLASCHAILLLKFFAVDPFSEEKALVNLQ